MVVVPRPACNVRRNDAETTPGLAILLLTQKANPNQVSVLSSPPYLSLTSSDRIDPQPKNVLVLPGSGLYSLLCKTSVCATTATCSLYPLA